MQVDTEVGLNSVLYVSIDNLHAIHTRISRPGSCDGMINGATASQTDKVLARGMLHKECIGLIVKSHYKCRYGCVWPQWQRYLADIFSVIK